MTENLKRDNELIIEIIMNSILQIQGQNNHIQTNSPRLSNFAMRTILGKDFLQAQVRAVHSTRPKIQKGAIQYSCNTI